MQKKDSWIMFRCSKDYKDRIKKVCKKGGVSITELVELALEPFLTKK
jgi:antitoxin component of RelBE/YafQ-DinJ toxin-antitoxin module